MKKLINRFREVYPNTFKLSWIKRSLLEIQCFLWYVTVLDLIVRSKKGLHKMECDTCWPCSVRVGCSKCIFWMNKWVLHLDRKKKKSLTLYSLRGNRRRNAGRRKKWRELCCFLLFDCSYREKIRGRKKIMWHFYFLF